MGSPKVLLCLFVKNTDIDKLSELFNLVKKLTYDNLELLVVDCSGGILSIKLDDMGVPHVKAPFISDQRQSKIIIFNYIRELFLKGGAHWLFMLSENIEIIDAETIQKLLENILKQGF